jgi:hypothetical protein
MSYLDDLKKKAQNAYNTASNVYNAAKEGVQNVYNAATGQKPAAQNTQPTAAAQPQQSQQANQTQKDQQAEVDWAAEYDKAMQDKSSASGVTPQGAQQTQPVSSPAAQAALGEGAGQWQAELDNVMAQIMGQGKFEYNMNGDAMYQQYADMYKNNANLAMQNAMAQASAMSGGYGSSYAQMVGQQAFAQEMQGLNDVGLELYDRAYAQDQAARNDLKDQYNMLAAREEQAYNRGIDERNFEYQQGRDETADSQWQQSFDYNKYLDEIEQSNYEKEFEYQQGRDNVADEQWNKQFASNEEQRAEDNAYRDEAFEYTKEQDKIAQEQWKAELDRALANDKISQQQWQAEMDRLNANDKTAENQWKQSFDYNKYLDELEQSNYENEFEYQQGRDEVADEQWNKQFTEQQTQNAADNKYRNDALAQDQNQFNASMDWQREEYDKMYGENGYMTKKDEQDQKNWQAQFDREGEWYDDAQEAAKPTTKYEGEGALNGQEVPKQLSGVQGLTTTNPGLFDDNGYFKQAAVVNENDNGSMTYNIGGKNVSVQKGTSPYTNTKNPDAKNGTFDNGYQPNNVASYYNGNKEAGKLSKAGFNTIINGQEVPVFTTPDGKEWVYDAANNKYSEYEYEEKKEPTKITLPTPTGGKSNVEMKPTGFR